MTEVITVSKEKLLQSILNILIYVSAQLFIFKYFAGAATLFPASPQQKELSILGKGGRVKMKMDTTLWEKQTKQATESLAVTGGDKETFDVSK